VIKQRIKRKCAFRTLWTEFKSCADGKAESNIMVLGNGKLNGNE
jgi:hypothetical protein